MDSTENATKIRQVMGKFVEAWNCHDAKAFSMVFAEDADFTNVRGMRAHGRAVIEQFHAPLFETFFKSSRQTITDTKIRFLKPDVAAVDAQWEMSGARNADGTQRPLRKGLLNLVMLKQAGDWLIAVMHNMELSST